MPIARKIIFFTHFDGRQLSNALLGNLDSIRQQPGTCFLRFAVQSMESVA
jgi:hypothetical protein